MSVHSELDIPFEMGKSLPCVVTQPTSTSSAVGVMLAHGAGGDLQSGNLTYHAEDFASAGFPCLRFTCKPTRLPYRVKACQGARVASAMAAANPGQALGCVFFSYPLHPVGDQANLRDDPLVDLTLPVLFVRGSQDSMCEGRVFSAVKARMTSADLQVHEVAGADHGLKVHAGKESKSKTEQALQAVSEAVCGFVQKLEQEYLAKQVVPGAQQQTADSNQNSSTEDQAAAAKRKRKRT